MKRKIIAAFLLAVTAIIAALLLTRFSFNKILGTVRQLSAPNEKLTQLNKVFTEITMLDQQQRAEAIQNPQKPYKYFLDQSGFLHAMIDSLRMLPWDDVQQKRLNSLQGILNERNQIFVSYMKVKAELADNKEFSGQLDTLAILLKESQRTADSSIVTTEQKKITTILPDSSQQIAKAADGNFLKRLFARKKKKDAATLKVQEELKVKIDTVTVARESEINYDQIHKVIKDLETDQRQQRKRLYDKELDLIHANSLFINQLLNTLEEVENEELANMHASNEQAVSVVNEGISRMNLLVMGFIAGTAVLLFFIFADISKSNYYKAQLEQAKTHAEELSKIKQRFLANMSHEIRTPLQSIIGFTEQLRQEQSDNEAVAAIQTSSEHLLHIVNEVLDYSRISSGSFTLHPEAFNLRSLLKEIESGMRIQANRKELKLIVETLGDTNEFINGDAFRLRQILYNLLGNAIKFTHDGNVSLAVQTTDEGANLKCLFRITDTGIGMTAEELSKVFNHFEQANSRISKTYGGTGLGLTIVKALVDVQGGTIEVASEPGKGTTFTLTLAYPKAERPSGEPHETIAQPEQDIHAMVVDDDPMIIKLCSLILSKNEVNHRAFNNPLQLLDRDYDESITHFLIDIRMPEMSGIQLCRELRRKYGSKTKFIALTAHVLPEERDSLLQQGFDEVLPKPFHEADLMKALGKTIKVKAAVYTHDFSELKRMTMGDEALFQSIIQQFLEESDDDLISLREEVASADRTKVREIVHKLAGRFGQMGLSGLSTKWHDIEIMIVDGKDLKTVSKEVNEAIDESDVLLNSIRISNEAVSP